MEGSSRRVRDGEASLSIQINLLFVPFKFILHTIDVLFAKCVSKSAEYSDNDFLHSLRRKVRDINFPDLCVTRRKWIESAARDCMALLEMHHGCRESSSWDHALLMLEPADDYSDSGSVCEQWSPADGLYVISMRPHT